MPCPAGVSPPAHHSYSPTPVRSEKLGAASPLVDDQRTNYRHHASKAERLVQSDSGALELHARSPNSVYIVPDQRSGYVARL